jgi:hypothetical protein
VPFSLRIPAGQHTLRWDGKGKFREETRLNCRAQQVYTENNDEKIKKINDPAKPFPGDFSTSRVQNQKPVTNGARATPMKSRDLRLL